jgi:hypothetical protein
MIFGFGRSKGLQPQPRPARRGRQVDRETVSDLVPECKPVAMTRLWKPRRGRSGSTKS